MVFNRLVKHYLVLSRLSRSRGVARIIPYYNKRFNSPNSGQPSQPQPGQPQPGQVNPDPLDQDAGDDDKGKSKGQGDDPNWKSTAFKMMETGATTFTSIAILGCVLASFAGSRLIIGCVLTPTVLLGTRTISTTNI